jgi:hypothetical protein
MAAIKRRTSIKAKQKKRLPLAYPFTHDLLPPGENPFPEKLKKAQDIISRTKFLDSK